MVEGEVGEEESSPKVPDGEPPPEAGITRVDVRLSGGCVAWWLTRARALG